MPRSASGDSSHAGTLPVQCTKCSVDVKVKKEAPDADGAGGLLLFS